MNITGIILAGGNSSRMGSNKATMMLNNKRLIDYVYDSIKPICNQILISSNTSNYNLSGTIQVFDKIQNIGPIAGIYSTLQVSKSQLNIIVSCDTPFVTSEMFSHLLQRCDNYDITLASHEGITEPMIGIYSKNCLPIIEQSIQNQNFKPPAIIRKCLHQFIDIHSDLPFYIENLFFNINTLEDLQSAEKELLKQHKVLSFLA